MAVLGAGWDPPNPCQYTLTLWGWAHPGARAAENRVCPYKNRPRTQDTGK